MNKKELIDYVASASKVNRAEANRMLEATLHAFSEALKKKEDITLIGFGTFSVVSVPAREGRNPRTGEKIKISARRKPVFKPSKALKDSINAV